MITFLKKRDPNFRCTVLVLFSFSNVFIHTEGDMNLNGVIVAFNLCFPTKNNYRKLFFLSIQGFPVGNHNDRSGI